MSNTIASRNQVIIILELNYMSIITTSDILNILSEKQSLAT
jgi:hypothetical protein